jgi:hypothetical protein
MCFNKMSATDIQVRHRAAPGDGGNRSHPVRRFIKKNVQHPTCKAFAELGKAIKAVMAGCATRQLRGEAQAVSRAASLSDDGQAAFVERAVADQLILERRGIRFPSS